MKKNIYILSLVFLLVQTMPSAAQTLKGNVTISGAFALYPMAVKWAEEFSKLNPEVKIDISAGGAGKGMTDVLSGTADIGLVSREINPEEIRKGAFPVAVTKDAVIPTVSSTNPLLDFILKKGVKKDAFTKLWISGQTKTWGQILSIKATLPVHVYTRSDAAGAAETWARYFGKKQEDLQGVGVFGDPGLATAVKKDASGIGYNNIVYIYDSKTKQQTNGVRAVPIDLNNNGKIDPDENFYDTVDDIINAIATGKYPSPPARDLYFVFKGKPQNPVVTAFINYILTEGQKFVHEAGYITLSKERITGELNKIK
jgi:phosphate transport system substrate-binding protein